tara:strand:+ start:851 stop:1063 length:213 start_codon:yes stop_codon:yes gene_type:complete
MIVSILTTLRKMLMNCQSIERLKRDKKETLHYRKKLLKKGKTVLAAKMLKKASYIDQHLSDMQAIHMGGR